jgi:hypothetical protein
VSAPWRLRHQGLTVTMHELLHDGISVTDSLTGEKHTEHSERELQALVDIFQHKIDMFNEDWDNARNEELWLDGTQSSLGFPGITGWIVDDPTDAVVVGGIDQSANTLWRNRADLAISLGSSAESQAVILTLDSELRQLVRYKGKPNVGLAGAGMMERLEAEYRAKGVYTQSGWAKGVDLSVGDLSYKGITFKYDPTLDDLGYENRLYLIDSNRIFPFIVDGEDEKMHHPARPENKYVFYKARTWVGGMIADQRNCHGVYAFA